MDFTKNIGLPFQGFKKTKSKPGVDSGGCEVELIHMEVDSHSPQELAFTVDPHLTAEGYFLLA